MTKTMIETFEKLCITSGRVLLGVYFILPGISKITGWEQNVQYMADHGMVFIPFFLVLTIIIQIGGGFAMVAGYQTKFIAFILAGLTLVISLVMHDFWTMPAGELQTNHELQNFVKNLAIMAGLLAVAGLGGGAWSLDHKRS
ncbi:MAG: DoxX family protein [Pseudomonadales bacterium]|nr:DoxX family protein [Pseudomonadales bacterium]